MWGQAYIEHTVKRNGGIIPTRVGTSIFTPRFLLIREDHPHACGDKIISIDVPILLAGSSPRVWGQGPYFTVHLFRLGIIPTRVGTSINDSLRRRDFWDHPHACGDKFDYLEICTDKRGSSPRVWGQVFIALVMEFFLRIIPTRVGTSNMCLIATVGRDHPHACGDKTKEIKENSGFAKSTA